MKLLIHYCLRLPVIFSVLAPNILWVAFLLHVLDELKFISVGDGLHLHKFRGFLARSMLSVSSVTVILQSTLCNWHSSENFFVIQTGRTEKT